MKLEKMRHRAMDDAMMEGQILRRLQFFDHSLQYPETPNKS